MKARGLGFNELDRLLGRSEGYTSRMVSEDRMPRADTLRAIAHALTVSPAWLLDGTEPMNAMRDGVRHESAEGASRRSRPRYPNLERSIAYWESQHRWSSATLTAARDMQLDADDDPSPQWWTEQLDRFEDAIRKAMLDRIGEPLAGDPVLDAKAKRKRR